MTRNIGLKVPEPKRECDDAHCPFHGSLSVRGKVFDGTVKSSKARGTITLQKETPIYYPKFKRYARSRSTIHAHLPACLDVEEGDRVIAAECRPIAKSVSYVIVEVRK